MTTENRLHRSRRSSVIFGVAGGLAEYFAIDPVMMRIIFALIIFVTGGAAILLYFLLALVIPREGDGEPGQPVGNHFGKRTSVLAGILIAIGLVAGKTTTIPRVSGVSNPTPPHQTAGTQRYENRTSSERHPKPKLPGMFYSAVVLRSFNLP